MKVSPVASPHAMSTQQTTGNNDARARAISMLSGNGGAAQAAAPAVANQNSISPEEMSAVKDHSEEIKDSGQADVSEAQVEETAAPVVEKVEEETALSKQFAQLARQEKILRQKAQQQEQAIKAREEALKLREAQILAKDEQYKSGYIPKDRLTKDTWGVLSEHGITYDKLTEEVMNQAPSNPRYDAVISKLEAKIQELEAGQENSAKSYKEQQAQAYQAAVNQIKTDVTSLVKSSEEFEAIRQMGSEQDVVDLITQTYDKEGVLLTVEEAASEVEAYLIEEAMKLTKLNKIKKQLSQTGSATPATAATGKTAGTDSKQTQAVGMKTLTNAAASSRQLSARERALLAFKGELKS